MATLTDLVTQASLKIGADLISSLSEETKEASVLGSNWPHVLAKCLDAAPWKFATKTLELSRLTSTPADPNWQYEFQLPGDLRTIRYAMDSSGRTLGSGTYIIEGQHLLSNLERVFLKYGRLYSEADVVTLPTWFCSYFICSLSYEASESIVGLGSVTERCLRDANITFNQAKKADGQYEPGSAIPHTTWRLERWMARYR